MSNENKLQHVQTNNGIKCTKCKKSWNPTDSDIKPDKTIMKTCHKCRENGRKYRKRRNDKKKVEEKNEKVEDVKNVKVEDVKIEKVDIVKNEENEKLKNLIFDKSNPVEEFQKILRKDWTIKQIEEGDEYYAEQRRKKERDFFEKKMKELIEDRDFYKRERERFLKRKETIEMDNEEYKKCKEYVEIKIKELEECKKLSKKEEKELNKYYEAFEYFNSFCYCDANMEQIEWCEEFILNHQVGYTIANEKIDRLKEIMMMWKKMIKEEDEKKNEDDEDDKELSREDLQKIFQEIRNRNETHKKYISECKITQEQIRKKRLAFLKIRKNIREIRETIECWFGVYSDTLLRAHKYEEIFNEHEDELEKYTKARAEYEKLYGEYENFHGECDEMEREEFRYMMLLNVL